MAAFLKLIPTHSSFASADVLCRPVLVQSHIPAARNLSTQKISSSRNVYGFCHGAVFSATRQFRSASMSSAVSGVNETKPSISCETATSASIIDGKKISQAIKEELKLEVDDLVKAGLKRPGLAVVLVGERKDSATYVRSKKKGCEEVGIVSFGVDLPEDATQEEVLKVVSDLNSNPDVHGILVQLPLPAHIDKEVVLGAISLEKDVDGFHPINVGRLCMSGRTKPSAVACTPKGCIELLERSGVEIRGKKAVVLGRSNVVGLPAAMLLMQRDATVTICHSKTANLPDVVAEADIIIAAIGQPELVKKSWVKPGAVVIDVGINAKNDPSSPKGYRLVGDVDYPEVSQVAGKITPVPGGVGPMTIAMLLRNTVDCAKRIEGFSS